jgi:hypothetical protein
MFSLFVEGGVIQMTILTLMFIALFLAAWKAPAWVKEIGKMAAVLGVIASLIAFIILAGEVSAAGGAISQVIVWGGLRVTFITPLYGLLIYFVSLIIRIVQKPRI